ncbi:Gfo/Idh/MocA family oxidoreductase [Candidatus Mycoplasma pogonae]
MAKIKIGVVGLGRMGFTHAQNIKNLVPDGELIALCSHDGKAFELQKEWNIKYAYDDYEVMLKNPEIDAVVIVTSTNLHPKHILQALAAQKHVFCEKPLGVDLQQCIDLIQQAKNYPNQVVQLGFMRRYDAEYAEAKKRIDENRIGQPIMVRAFSEDPELDVANMFKFGPTSGGQFVDVSAHDLDLMVWYLNSYPKKVWGLGKAYKYPEFASWNDGDVVGGMIEFHNGTIGMLVASRIGPQGYQAQADIMGTNGHLHVGMIDMNHNVVEMNQHGAIYSYHRNFNSRFQNAYVAEINAFVNKILNHDYDKSQLDEALVNIIASKTAQEAFVKNELLEVVYPTEIEIK